jgi:hypothetical protein
MSMIPFLVPLPFVPPSRTGRQPHQILPEVSAKVNAISTHNSEFNFSFNPKREFEFYYLYTIML